MTRDVILRKSIYYDVISIAYINATYTSATFFP